MGEGVVVAHWWLASGGSWVGGTVVAHEETVLV